MRPKLFALVMGISLLALLMIPSGQQRSTAQEACPAGFGCAQVTLLPNTLLGDFFVGEALVAAAQNSAVLQVPPAQNQTVTIRNITDTAVGFGQLFIYEETSLTVNVRDGQLRQFTARPRKTFIRGTLSFTCTIANVREGENAACLVIVDGVPLGEVALNQKAEFILDPGSRALQTQLVGVNANLWSPPLWESAVTITAGRITNARSQFTKLAKVTLTLNQPNVVGDFYVDGELIAAQAPSAERYITPSQPHTVEVRSLTDPAGAGVYFWRDAATTITLGAGQERTVQVRLQKELLPTPVPASSVPPVAGAAPACLVDFDFAVCAQYQPEPRNCDEVKARGIPERAAACCFPARDRDKDGTACYGG